MKKILVVEDDRRISDIIVEFLSSTDYLITVANNGMEGLEKAKKTSFDLIITDVMMPVMNGYQMILEIRKFSKIPIFVITALSSEKDQVVAYDLEADDFISKPFSPLVLLKKVQNLFKRASKITDGPAKNIQYGEYRTDFENLRVFKGDEPIPLSMTEYQLFEAFLSNPTRALTREWLLENVWGYEDFTDTRIVDTQIKNIRKKIGYDAIDTIHGKGYKIKQADNVQTNNKN